MKVAVSAQRPVIDSPVDPRFGRASWFLICDTEGGEVEVIENTANAEASQGAGIQSAQLIARRSVDVVVSGNMGPKAFEALQAAGVTMVAWSEGTVADAVELIRSGRYQPIGSANARSHWK